MEFHGCTAEATGGWLASPQDGRDNREPRLAGTAQYCEKGSLRLCRAVKSKMRLWFLSLLFITVINTIERECYLTSKAQSQSITEGSQQEPGSRNQRRDHEGMSLPGLLLMDCSVCYLIYPGITCLGMAPPSSGISPPTSIISQENKCPMELFTGETEGVIPQWMFLLPSRLLKRKRCQGKK